MFKLPVPGTKRSCFLMLLVGTSMSVPASAADFGRFFTTAEQRDQLQALRFAPPPKPVVDIPEPEPEVETVVEVEEPKPDIPGIDLNGYVTRQHGESTVWINGRNSSSGDLESQYLDVRPVDRKQQRVPVNIRVNDRGVSLKPGQKYLPDSDAVVETYRGTSAADETEDTAASSPEG